MEPNYGMFEHAGLPSVSFCFGSAVGGTLTRGGGVTVGLVTVHGCVLGCRMWSVAGDILFDQLSRGFRKRRGKCALAKWTYSTWRAYRSVFTCLLSQVVQTARLPFHSDSGQYADCFCTAGRVNGTNTGKCLQSSKLAQDTFRLNLCKIICKKTKCKNTSCILSKLDFYFLVMIYLL